MSESTITQDILVELDCLLDTRAGTLARLGDDLVEQVLKSGYHTRRADWFEGVDMAEYERLYKGRDVITLAHSYPTDCFKTVRDLVRKIEQTVTEQNSPYGRVNRIFVNTYPYKLSAEEQAEIGKALVVRFGTMTPVELVHLATKDLSPKHVRENYGFMFLYEYDPWLSEHFNVDPTKDDIRHALKNLLLNVTVFSPAIYYKKPPTVEEEDKLAKEIGHPLKLIETYAQTIVCLQLLDVAHFSLFRVTSPA